MASWKDGLRAASFRGVPFQFLDTEGEGGRRLVEHEYPFRDTADTEDLGKKNRTYRLQAYVIGDDYFAQRDALLAALETAGPGTLVHPYMGVLTVNVRQPFKWRETAREGRMATFDLVFVDTGAQPSPTSATDTAGGSIVAAGAANTQLQSSFSQGFAVAGFPATVTAAAASLVASAQGQLNALLATPGVSASSLAAMVSGLSVLVSEPGQLAAQVTTFFDSYVNALTGSFTAFDDTLSSRGPQPVADPSYGLAACAAWGSALPAVATTTPQLQQEADNQAAMIALIRGAAVAALAQVYANTDFVSQEDAETARDQVTGLLDGLIVAASQAGDDAGCASFEALYAAVALDLSSRGKQLPDVVTYVFAQALPALTVAERLYQDASRAGELIARNAAPHPLFMPLQVEALSS